MTWQFLRGFKGEGSNSEELKRHRLRWGVDGWLAAAEENSTGGAAVEVGGDAACGERGGDEGDLALVGASCGQSLRHEEEVAVLVGLLLLLQTVFCVVAFQLHHSTSKRNGSDESVDSPKLAGLAVDDALNSHLLPQGRIFRRLHRWVSGGLHRWMSRGLNGRMSRWFDRWVGRGWGRWRVTWGRGRWRVAWGRGMWVARGWGRWSVAGRRSGKGAGGRGRGVVVVMVGRMWGFSRWVIC